MPESQQTMDNMVEEIFELTKLIYTARSRQPAGPDELYDTQTDPGEVRNLATDPAHASELARLRGRLIAWMDETGDRLLNPWTRVSLLEGRTI